MAQCEKCGTGGHEMKNMAVDEEKKTFVGPCCVKTVPSVEEQWRYGLEFSSDVGIRAYATYGGFSVEFKKTREELQTWLEQRQEAQMQEEMTSSGPTTEMVN